MLGATSDIGFEITKKILSCNPSEVIATGRNIKRLNQFKSAQVKLVQCDLEDDKQLDNILSTSKPLDGIVVSIGHVYFRPIKNENRENILKTSNEHFINIANAISNICKNKLLARGSSIVFISSIDGLFATSIGSCIYSSMKAAVCGLSMNLAKELAPLGIRSNCVCAGIIETTKIQNMFSEEKITEFKKMHPLKRLGTPGDIANSVIFLLSDDSSWITGINLKVDGGFTL